MLEKCNINCIETEGDLGFIPCTDTIKTDCVILGEDMNLCSIDIKSTDSLKKIISAFDKVLCTIKDKTIEVVYEDIDTTGSCITKALITNTITGKKTIKLGLDNTCLCNTVIDCQPIAVSPFLISASDYSICGTQVAVLTSTTNNTIWYDQSGTVIGNGFIKSVSRGGLYYASSGNKISNVINIVYQVVCDTYSYTKVKNFYKSCPDGSSSSEYTYSKVYLSEISYQDATIKADLDSSLFDQQGQSIINQTGTCIDGNPPTSTGCFNIILSSGTCGSVPNSPSPVIIPTPSPSPSPVVIPSSNPVSPVPTAIPSPSPVVIVPTPSPVVPTPVSCNLSIEVTNTSCTALSSCINGATFAITSVTNFIGTTRYDVVFNASNLRSTTVVVKNSIGSIVNTFTQSITANPMRIDLGVLGSGDYTLQFEGLSCEGTSNAFLFTVSTVAPDGVSPTPVATQVPTQSFASFSNVLKTVPTELTNGKYSPQLFPIIETPLDTDTAIGRIYPNWAVAWQAEGKNFSDNSRTTVNVGINFMYDRLPGFYGGYGERCLDYISITNPNTGQDYPGGIDPVCNKTINTFTTRIPFQERALSLYGVASTSDRNDWIANSTSWVFDKGVEGVSSRNYGWGDRVNGKVNTGLANADIEIGLEQGFVDYPKHLSFLLGMGSASQGYVFSQYSAAINGVGVDLSYYPDDNGNFTALKKKLDGTNFLDGDGNTVENNIPLSPDWNPTSKITISDKGIIDKGVIDFPNVLPCIEISSTSDMTYRHGQTYARKNGWKYEYVVRKTTTPNGNPVPNTNPQLYDYSGFELSYDVNNPIENTVVDKFGMDRNTNHIIADIICYGDVNKWWSVNKLNNRKVILQSKITCDRANLGVFYDAGFTNQDLRFKHYDRRYGFIIGGFTALTGCEWQIWDRNTEENLDGYHGAFGVINLMNQRKSFGNNISESYASLKPRLNFLLWNSEISYNNGPYVRDKANEYILSENKLPQRQAISSDGYWVIFAARPEGIEPTTAKFRVVYGGVTYYHEVTADMWESTSKQDENITLANIPLARKDYYYNIIKLSNTPVTPIPVTPTPVLANTFNVTTNGNSNYIINGQSNSTLSLTEGQTYTFNINATGHPFWIKTVNSTGTTNQYNTGVTNNGIANGTITFIVPYDVPSTLYYNCQIHSSMAGIINITNVPTPVVAPTSPVPSSVIPSNTVNVFIMAGESNSGTRNTSSTLLAGEGGVRTGVRIWNNNTNILEPLNIGVNNALDENDVIAPGWGWENQLANLRRDGVLNSDIVVVKTGQGGAFIQSYHPTRTTPNPNYYNRTLTKINGVKAALLAEGKTPVFYIMYSQGINDALADGGNGTDPENFPGLSGSTYWKAATLAHLQRLRDVTGATTKICLMKFFNLPGLQIGVYANTKIDEIVASNPNNLSINTADLTSQLYSDQVHFNQISTKTVTDRYINAFGFGSLSPDSTPVSPVPTPVPASPTPVASTNYCDPYNTGYDSGNINEFRDYTVNVPSTGSYTITVNYATGETPTGNMVISGVTRTFSLPSTGSLTTFATITALTNITLNAGNNTIKLYATVNTARFKQVCAVGNATPAAPTSSTPTVPTPSPTVPAPITPIPSPVPVSSNVVIVEPNRPQYYFSDMKAPSYYSDVTHSPLPAMYPATSLREGALQIPSGTLLSTYITMNEQYNATDDIVYLKNNQVEFGINLKRGGHVAIARKAGETFNYIYNGFDGGFQVGLDAYQRPDGYTQQGEVSGSGIPGSPTFSYNVTHGGDYNNNSVSLINYYPITNGYYVKLRPIHYPLSGKHSETYIEAWYTLQGRILKCQYKHTSFRTDDQVVNGFQINGWGIPACFLNNTLTRYKAYTGDSPYTNASLTDGLIPTTGQNNCATPVEIKTKEFWAMAYNPNTGNGFGVYNASEGGNLVEIVVKQCQTSPFVTSGNEFSGGYTFMQPNITISYITGGTFVKNSTAYITVGNESEIRSSFNALNQI